MSDGVTDVHRSNEISSYLSRINYLEINFFSNPTRENLELIYSECDKLYSLPYSKGYWGENPQHISEKIRKEYQRFDRKENLKVSFDDFTDFLNRINPESRLEEIALFSVIKEIGIPTKENADKIFLSFRRELDYLKSRITISQLELIRGDSKEFNGKELENLLTDLGIRERFPFSEEENKNGRNP